MFCSKSQHFTSQSSEALNRYGCLQQGLDSVTSHTDSCTLHVDLAPVAAVFAH